ncbi:ankyrin repeat protein, putative [Trichomonas vaginalis G3]|uniref:Ankyrin repeat protein, putative n=1 Tax=Trichomonas vaginalis (strain ATCC PRA-98 / G3) TaxID=412133 RepID=A2ERA8_TRIV3|nr:ankyrin repeat and SOCS box-containing protein 4 family [Trichomonas vaginalis G3]EAY04784.1 ankyrin repeat protein, putative [Trichomonas vaginalis G3]KAI5490985.1 ankyrin repeat and SOCS box-containing protein 4 family [Trichomonas vaginalis G3]|eukprot:XP_001317007.1 ankyrin repeat protein [Trichomonas vaginalis G3]
MSEQDILPNKYSELRGIYKSYIDTCNALYQLKTENEEELNSIYKMIKTELIDSKKYHPRNIIYDILKLIEYNNRYKKSYLYLCKLISDDFNIKFIWNLNVSIHENDTIYRAIMENDKERFIALTEGYSYPLLRSSLYPYNSIGYSLLELCCYHGAVDCFKFLRTKYKSEIYNRCLELSFLGGNPEIMNECLKYRKPDKWCMTYAIISHNIDFVAFLRNEYKIEIDLYDCGLFNNLEAFLVYFDQTNDIDNCFIYSTMFNIPALCEYFLSQGANINYKNQEEITALHLAAIKNRKEVVEFLLSHGANINEINEDGQTALHYAASNNSKETAELLISHGANINEMDEDRKTALHFAISSGSKVTAELLISHGADINKKDRDGKTAFHMAADQNSKAIAEFLLSLGANINEKDKRGLTALHYAASRNYKEMAEFLISHGANIKTIDEDGRTAFIHAAMQNSIETVEFLFSHGAHINRKDHYGSTALHYAALGYADETVKFLLLHGAHIDEKIVEEKLLFILQHFKIEKKQSKF